MPTFTLDCKHPNLELEESYIEENPPGHSFRYARYWCPDCNEMIEKTGPMGRRRAP